MWIVLEDGLFLFGAGGITRVERYDGYDTYQKPISGAILYSGTTRIAVTKCSVESINELLGQHHGQ